MNIRGYRTQTTICSRRRGCGVGWGGVSDVMWWTSIGWSDRLVCYYTQTANIQHFEQRVVSVYTMRKLAESVVATRIHQEILAHARLSNCTRDFLPICAQNVCVTTAGYVEMEGKYLL